MTDATAASPEPLVSVVSITYNHEKFIAAALDGFVAQQTEFPVEVIVADDASTDGTVDIINAYRDRHPGLIRPILRPRNVGIHSNLTDALSSARGSYIALCEGDDYWTDPLKLSKQIRHLEQNPEVAVCFHRVRVRWEDERADDIIFPPDDFSDSLELRTLLTKNFIQTNSVVYRRLPSYHDIPDVMPLDWYLHARHATTGSIAMLPDVMSVYRRHAEGVWADRVIDIERFLRQRGPGQMALYEAMLGLLPGDDQAARGIGSLAAATFGEFATLSSEEEIVATTVAAVDQSPRVAALAIQHQHSVIDDLTARLKEATADLAARQGRLNDADAQIAELKKRRTASRERVAKQRARIKRQRRRVESLREKNAALKAALQEAQARRLSSRVGRLGRRLGNRLRLIAAKPD